MKESFFKVKKLVLDKKYVSIAVFFVLLLVVGLFSSRYKDFFDFGDPSPERLAFLNQNVNPWADERTPEYQGEIKKLSRKFDSCFGLDNEDAVRCVYKELEPIAKTYGARVGMDVAVYLAEKHPFLEDHSHDIAHVVGFGALRYDYGGGDVVDNIEGFSDYELKLIDRMGRALVDCYSWGVMGCMHGVIEAGVGELPLERRASAMKRACLENPLIQSNQVYVNHCLHWLGHGMAIFTEQTLIETLNQCESLGESFESENVQLCISGVFHAGVAPGRSDDEYLHNIEKIYSETDPFFPCQEIPQKFIKACYAALPGRAPGDALESTFGVCRDIPAEGELLSEYKDACYDTAANVLLYDVEHKEKPIVEACRQYTEDEYVETCYAGAVRYLILRRPILDNDTPFNICELVEDTAKETCYEALGATIKETFYNNDVSERYCGKITEDGYKEVCMNGAKF